MAIQWFPGHMHLTRKAIAERYDGSYLPDKPRQYQTKAKNAQEAHEAIRPTDFTRDRAGSGDHAKLYELIHKRALASQMASARMERTTVELVDGTGQHGLRATGQVVLFPGFLALYEEGRDDPDRGSGKNASADAEDEDGKLLPRTPAQAFARGQASDVPLIIGWNSGEDSVAFGGALTGGEPMTPERRQAFTDGVFGAPARWIAGKAAGGKPAWLYHFSYVGSRFRPRVTTAAHAAEIQYVWEYWGRRTPMSVVSDEDRAMATLMHGCWVAFARTGAPNCAGWPAYTPATDQLLEFGSPTAVRTGFRKAQLDAAETAMGGVR